MTSPPPGKRWHTREDSGIRLDRQLRWWHDDAPVEHPKIIDAFNRGLVVAEDGGFELRFGSDWCRVEVEDAAFEVRSVHFSSPDAEDAPLLLSLSDGRTEPLVVASLTEGDEGALECRVKAGRAKARFSRSAQLELGEWIVEVEDGGYVLRLPGGDHPLAQLGRA